MRVLRHGSCWHVAQERPVVGELWRSGPEPKMKDPNGSLAPRPLDATLYLWYWWASLAMALRMSSKDVAAEGASP